MNRRSILRSIPCDLTRLPIGTLEAFVLSQVHGGAPAEEVAETTGLDLVELLVVAKHLVRLGALSVDDDRPKVKTKRPTAPPRARPTTVPPRARSLVPPAVVPLVCKRPDLRSLEIGPREGFVLSQIDGKTSTADLGEVTGLSARGLSDVLHALERAGVVQLGPGKHPTTRPFSVAPSKPPHARATKPPAARVSKAPPPRVSKAPPPRATKAPASRMSKAPPPASKVPPKPAKDISDADRARIGDASVRIEGLDHYGVLGVERSSDVKTIRRAYHALAAQFHPDRYFGKNLGPHRQPLERVFSRLTLAYETLSKKAARAQYDATLAPAPTPEPTEKPAPVRRTTRKSMQAARPPASAPSRPPVAAPAAPPPPPSPPSPPIPPSPPPSVQRPPLAPPPPSPSSPDPVGSDPLLRMYATKRRDAVQDHLDVFLRAAKEALDRDDVVAAANHYRLAAQCSNDPAVAAALAEIEAKARARVREVSLAGAHAAEKAGRWAEAAAKFAKAYGAHAEAWIAERAAHAMRREGRDLRRAAQLGEQAVLAEPHNVAYRVTLGEVYFDIGMMARAAGEAARALALSPSDPGANALSKLVAKAKPA